MKKNYIIPFILLAAMTITIVACEKDFVARTPAPTPPPAAQVSFTEEFDNVGNLTAKGWVFQNNSDPIGQSGWRQGRYESATSVQYKFLAPVPFLGFPAYSATSTPNDFISADASVSTDALTGTSNMSAWLISPSLPLKDGDKISFYTRASDDSYYSVYCKDRMQVRANFTDGTPYVGTAHSSVGKFTTLLLDINPNYIYNDPSGTGGIEGYPRAWKKYTITLANIPGGSIPAGRFAFRYLGEDAGLFGGSSGDNFPTVVGIDQLVFEHN